VCNFRILRGGMRTYSRSILRGNISGDVSGLPPRAVGPLAAWNAHVDLERVKQLEHQLATLREQLARSGSGHLRKAG